GPTRSNLVRNFSRRQPHRRNDSLPGAACQPADRPRRPALKRRNVGSTITIPRRLPREPTMAGWQISGQYMETCNCTMLCPCIYSNLAARPTEGDCKAALGMHIDKGAKDDGDLCGPFCVI